MEVSPKPQLSPEALAVLQKTGKDPKELTPEQIEFLNSKLGAKKEKSAENKTEQNQNVKREKDKGQNTQKSETAKKELKNMEGQELTPEKAERFRQISKEMDIETVRSKEELTPIAEVVNKEFQQELGSLKTFAAYFGENDPEQEKMFKKNCGEMLFLAINQVYKGAKIPEATFGSTGSEGTAFHNLYRLITTIYDHDQIFDPQGRMTPDGVVLIDSIALTLYGLEKEYGSIERALRDDREGNLFYCIDRQEFVGRRVEGVGGKEVWKGEKIIT